MFLTCQHMLTAQKVTAALDCRTLVLSPPQASTAWNMLGRHVPKAAINSELNEPTSISPMQPKITVLQAIRGKAKGEDDERQA